MGLNSWQDASRPAILSAPWTGIDDFQGFPEVSAMHYPRRLSKISRARKIGFRARMRTKGGRKMINRRRRIGRSLNFKK